MSVLRFATEDERNAVQVPFHALNDIGAELPYVALTGDDIPIVTSPRTIKAHEFRDRFTTQELAAMKAAELAGDVTAGLLLLNVQTADEGIPLDSQKVIDGLAYWVSIGVITPNRPAEIRA